MASAGDALRTALGKAVLQGTANTYTSGGTLWLALGTACTSAAGISEIPNSGNYARVAVVNNSTNWVESSTTPGAFTNGAAFTTGIASTPWPSPTFFALCNSATYAGGTTLVWNAMPATSVTQGQALNFAIGTLQVTIA